jgi:spore maturation protein CgeB
MKMAFYGSSLLSAYWNGAATYYRGMLSGLARLGWQITSTSRMRSIDKPIATLSHLIGQR